MKETKKSSFKLHESNTTVLKDQEFETILLFRRFFWQETVKTNIATGVSLSQNDSRRPSMTNLTWLRDRTRN